MKRKALILLTIVFFVAMNTSYYWEQVVGAWAFPITILLFLSFIVLGFSFLYHLIKATTEHFKLKDRKILLLVMICVLSLTLYAPRGLIDFEQFEVNNVLIAQREGVANCMFTLKLKENGSFKDRSVCFGVDITKGKYEIKNDTIWFASPSRDPEYYKFGVFTTRRNNRKTLLLYHHKKDTVPMFLWILKNELEGITYHTEFSK